MRREVTVFEVKAVAASGANVVVNLRIESTSRKNGRPFNNDVMHFWTFHDRGQITRYRHFNDTAAGLAAWRG